MPLEAGRPAALIVHASDLYRDALSRLLTDRGLTVVGEAASLEEGVAIAVKVRPDVIILDIDLAGSGAVAARRAVRRMADLGNVVVLTPPDGITADDGIDLILSGAVAYLPKDATVAKLYASIESAARGDTVLTRSAIPDLIKLGRIRSGGDGHPSVEHVLSRRELEVLELITAGYGNDAIASELTISPRTAKNHVSNILSKLGLHNRTQAAVYSVQAGIATREPPFDADSASEHDAE